MAKKPPASRRVRWPEPDRPEGNEFRLTWARLGGIILGLVSLAGAVPLYWTISDHWMNRAEIQTAMKAHAEHDAGIQAWNQFGFAQNRLDYLGDKQAECDAKRMVEDKLPTVDAAICARYEAQLKSKQTEANELRAKAMETTKEK